MLLGVAGIAIINNNNNKIVSILNARSFILRLCKHPAKFIECNIIIYTIVLLYINVVKNTIQTNVLYYNNIHAQYSSFHYI